MDFLTKEDFYSRISERLLAQIISDDNDKLDAAVSMAISKVRDRLDGNITLPWNSARVGMP